MDSFSVIVTACNNTATIARTLNSVDEALTHFFQQPCSRGVEAEVVIVDDGSSDATHAEIQKVRAERAAWKVVRRHEPSSPSCARNTGVRHCHGQVLFFLDGDDRFLPAHVTACWQALQDGQADFVKTGVKLADPVHPDWKGRIEGSVVINLAIRRRAHDQVGGFPDYLLFRRSAEGLRKEMDLFYKIEDQFYNQLAGRLLRGCLLATETVEYCRHPGNAYDRQYAKFCLPFGEWRQPLPREESIRLRVAEVLIDEWVHQEERRRAQEAGMPAARSLVEAARRSQQAGDLLQAERQCRQHIHQEPVDADAWQLQGGILVSQRKGVEAVAAFREALRLRPDSADSHYGLAVALTEQGQRVEAVGHYREVLRLRSEHIEALTNLGVLLAEMGRREEAVALLRQTVQLRPESAAAHHNLGVALAQLGQPEEGIKQLEAALRLRPDYADALYNLGNLLKDRGRKEEAVERYRQALTLRPGYASALNNLGLSLVELGKPEEAVVYLRQATHLQPTLKEAHMNLGLALAEGGQFEEGERAYHEALRLDPGYAEAHGNLANCPLPRSDRILVGILPICHPIGG